MFMLCVCHCRTCKRQHPSGKAQAEEGGVDEGVVEGGGLVGLGGKQYIYCQRLCVNPSGKVQAEVGGVDEGVKEVHKILPMAVRVRVERRE